MVTIADLRAIARTIDSPDDAPAALICRAAHATRGHLASAPVEASLRAIGWCDVDVRECVAALGEARRALWVAGLRRAGPHMVALSLSLAALSLSGLALVVLFAWSCDG